MTTTFRSNLKPGTTLWAGRRAQWRALGLSDEDLEKPKIAVVNSSSKLSSCFSHLDDLARTVCDAIREAGAIPFEVRTAASSDFITSAGCGGSYILPTRDLIVADIEASVEGALLDGMICLSSCDKTTPAHMMAAARLNLPTLIVIGGYQKTGHYKGEEVDIEEVFLKAGYIDSGSISVKELGEMADQAVQGPGVCAGMGTANTMHIAAEALGFALPGSAPVAALSAPMMDNAREAARRIVEIVRSGFKPRDWLDEGAFRNAACAVLSVSGSINAVKHLQAVAKEAETDVDVYRLFEELSQTLPLLSAVRPNGTGSIAQFEASGGARALLKRLEPVLDLNARNAVGARLADTLAGYEVPAGGIIQTLDQPVSSNPSLVFVRGSLLPGSGIARIGGTAKRRMHFSGLAVICHSRDEALARIREGRIERGSVLVLRGLGVKGGPGMAMTSAVVFALDGFGLIDDIAVITEGQLSGLVNKGLVVGEASPEAADGGPLGLLNDGDLITIDLHTRAVDHHLDDVVLQARRAEQRSYGVAVRPGLLTLYRANVTPVHEGATLLPPRGA